MKNWVIRKIEKKDNAAVAQLIRAVFDELNIPKVGTAYEDPYLDLMFEEYNKPKSVYYVVESDGKIVGSAGIAPLENEGFEKCYLETMPFMHAAQKLYLKSGFEYICASMGSTGHTSCPVWMLKELH